MHDLSKPSLVEALGLRPLGERLRQALVALRGAEDVPPSRFGPSSLRLLDPRLALPLWAGRFVVPRHAIVTNLFNHRQTPSEAGWSVRRTQTEDFRGRHLTYDRHNGTDFSIPVGTPVVAPAPGVVARVFAEYNRGGLKLCIDHGDGLMTCAAHLARALVREGERVRRGELVAVSGYSGLDALVTFPFGVPHVHFNVWLDGVPVDPFARAGEASLWLEGTPRPAPVRPPDEPFAPSRFDAERVAAIVASCVTPSVRARLAAEEPLERRAAHLVAERCYYPTRFGSHASPYAEAHARAPRLSMPFGADRFDGAVLADER
ncbi:MAG: M23 family metallopeptidase [Myxococcales bacterium]|nr:M23 family metallopeptidase [Myxococcales bacterium]